MKKHILHLVFFFMVIISVQAQYAPNIVKTGTQWVVVKGMWSMESRYEDQLTVIYFFGADTVIEGKTYKQVLRQEDFNPNREFRTHLAYREDESRLYVYTNREYLVCDFSLQPGDIMPMKNLYEHNAYVVDQVGDTVLPGATTALRYVKAHEKLSGKYDLWVENIGPLSQGIDWNPFWWEGMGGGYRDFMCCYDEMNTFYKVSPQEDCHLKEIHSNAEAFGAGKLVMLPSPVTKNFTGSDSVLCLRTEMRTYILAENWEWTPKRYITFSGITAAVGDCLSVEGTSNYGYDLNGKKYDELNIRSMRRIPCDKLASESITANNGAFLKVLPNPNNGNFRVEVNRPCSVEFYTETGVLVESRKVDVGTHNFSLGAGKTVASRAAGGTGKAAGLYILKAVTTDGQVLTRKIAIQ